MPALGQKLGYLYSKAETKTRKYTDWQTSQTFPHLGDKKTKRDEQKDILNNIGIGTGSPQRLKQGKADSRPGSRFALKYGYDEYHDKIDDTENA